MMNTHTDRKVTVSKTSPWTVKVDGVDHSTYPTRTAARAAAEDLKNGASAPDLFASGADARARRKELGLSRSDVAGKLGVSVYHLDRIESGKLEVPTALVDTLASL